MKFLIIQYSSLKKKKKQEDKNKQKQKQKQKQKEKRLLPLKNQQPKKQQVMYLLHLILLLFQAEYVRLRDEARKKDGDLEITEPDEKKPVLTENDSPEGTGPTEPEGVSDKKMFQEKDEVKMKPIDDKFRMGPYDGLCVFIR